MITIVYGTRPEAIKLGPVAAELRAAGAEFTTICTTQHTTLLRGTPAETDLKADADLGLQSDGNVLRWTKRAEAIIKMAVSGADLVVVQGDTMSAFAAARAAHSLMRPLAHVEAGIRSHNLHAPWPEEGFRVEIDRLADWYYAPTSTAYANLLAEGCPAERIRVTGNSGVSALARYTTVKPVAAPGDYALITLHRREWLNGPDFPGTLFTLFETAAAQPAARFIWPMHPAVSARLPERLIASLPPNMSLVPPLPYGEMVGLLAHAFGVLTDSGGLQEEAATLGVPCAVVRHVTDRPESIEAGVAQLFEPTPDGVRDALHLLVQGTLPRRAAPVFGDITAAAQIASHLASLMVTA